MHIRILQFACVTLVLALGLAATGRAADKEELKKRIKARQAKLDGYKGDGKVGETYQGKVEAVKSEYLDDEDLKTLVQNENSDRTALYTILAEENDTTADAIATVAAQEHKKRLKTGEYWKAKDGKWYRKK